MCKLAPANTCGYCNPLICHTTYYSGGNLGSAFLAKVTFAVAEQGCYHPSSVSLFRGSSLDESVVTTMDFVQARSRRAPTQHGVEQHQWCLDLRYISVSLRVRTSYRKITQGLLSLASANARGQPTKRSNENGYGAHVQAFRRNEMKS